MLRKSFGSMLLAALMLLILGALMASMADPTTYTTAYSVTTVTPPSVEVSTTYTVVVVPERSSTVRITYGLPSTTVLSALPENSSTTSFASLDLEPTSASISQQVTTTLATSFQTAVTSTILTRSVGTSSNPSSRSAYSPGAGNFSKLQIASITIIAAIVACLSVILLLWCTRKYRNGSYRSSSDGTSGVHDPELLSYPRGSHYNADQTSNFSHDYEGFTVGPSTRRMVSRDELSGRCVSSFRPSRKPVDEVKLPEIVMGPPTPPIPARSPLRPVSTQPVRPARPASILESALHFMDQRTPQVPGATGNVPSEANHQNIDNLPIGFAMTFPPPGLRKKLSSVYSA